MFFMNLALIGHIHEANTRYPYFGKPKRGSLALLLLWVIALKILLHRQSASKLIKNRLLSTSVELVLRSTMASTVLYRDFTMTRIIAVLSSSQHAS
ncbi:hypothetical protein GOP47_0022727 [Adiantum capillus-veneris]|uniref:Uncharacterized protein n=1 Tax=Adiantum capillus-veneris TaxID=13818 RepID=A0A9D4U650_ADICA|nr:hypothetical protein GOP47_0022727 [Adiantum capillus-veneris]